MVEPTVAATLLLEVLIFGLFVVAVRRGDTAAAINALVAFALVLFPSILAFALRTVFARHLQFGQALPFWLAIAGFLHTLGMLRRYESTWWWDHLTHTVSAALVAALVYAGVIVAFPDTSGLDRAATTVAATFAVGVCWELLELTARAVGERFDIEPVLVHYGWRDTGLDMVFDVVGALLVIGLDVRAFVPIAAQNPGGTGAMLVGGAWAVVLTSAAMAIVLGLRASLSL